MTSSSLLARTMIGRIQRYRLGRTDLPTLVLELHLLLEAHDIDRPGWLDAFHQSWSALAKSVGPLLDDPLTESEPDAATVDRHLTDLERILRCAG